MKEYITTLLKKALEDYGEETQLYVENDVDDRWEEYTSIDIFSIARPNYLNVRHSLMNQGRILEENIENNTYVVHAKMGKHRLGEAIVITHVEGNTIGIAAYAKEGLIKQHIAQKAVQQVKESVLKNCS